MPTTPALSAAQMRQIAKFGRAALTNPAVKKALKFGATKVDSYYRNKRDKYLAKKRGMEIQKLGQNVGLESAKKDEQVSNLTILSDINTLYTVDVTAIETDIGSVTAGEQRIGINKRIRNMVYLSGFRWRQQWRSEWTSPALIRWAIVSSNINTAPGIGNGMFKSYNDSRDQDFSDSMSTLEKQSFPLSRDKLRVYYEGKLFLPQEGNSTVYTEREGHNWVGIDKYFPIKRMVRFNDDSTQDCEDKVFAIWWATPYFGDTTVSVSSLITTQTSCIAYFREPGEVLLARAGIKRVGRTRPMYARQQNFIAY